MGSWTRGAVPFGRRCGVRQATRRNAPRHGDRGAARRSARAGVPGMRGRLIIVESVKIDDEEMITDCRRRGHRMLAWYELGGSMTFQHGENREAVISLDDEAPSEKRARFC